MTAPDRDQVANARREIAAAHDAAAGLVSARTVALLTIALDLLDERLGQQHTDPRQLGGAIVDTVRELGGQGGLGTAVLDASRALILADVETSGLHPHLGHVPWEVAAVEPDGTEHVWRWPLTPGQLADADDVALTIGGYHERAPQRHTGATERVGVQAEAAAEIAALLDGAVLVGVNVGFDAAMLGPWLRSYGHDLTAHYRPVPIDSVAVGFLLGYAQACRAMDNATAARMVVERLALPWRSDDVAAALMVAAPSEADRHTGLGDARWVHRIVQAVGLDQLPGVEVAP